MTRRQAVVAAALAARTGVQGRVVDADGQTVVVRALVGEDGRVVACEGIEVWRWGSVRLRVRRGDDLAGRWVACGWP